MLKSRLEFWMQSPAKERKNLKGSEEAMGEEEPWLVNTTQARLWIGRKRLIGCEIVFALAE